MAIIETTSMFFRQSEDVTPSGSDVDIAAMNEPIKAFYIGVAGDLKVQLVKDDTPVTLKNIPAGTLLELRVKTLFNVGTTAGNILALW